MLDKATVLTPLFTIVDDTMKGSVMIQDALKRPGPAPRLSDSEVITLALYQELIGEPREDHFFRLHQASLRRFFPGLNERSRYKRSKQVSEFVGTADYGVCSSKAMKYFGYKLHSVVSLSGLIMGFLLTAANSYDNQPVVELLDSFSHHL